MRFIFRAACLSACCLLGFHTTAQADFISVAPADYSGSRTTADGSIVATGGWSSSGSGFSIAWDIENLGTTFKYTYTMTAADLGELSKGLSHMLVTLSPTVDWTLEGVLENIVVTENGSVSAAVVTAGQTFEEGSDNPDLPVDLYGIKFDMASEDAKTVTISFESIQAPVWGSFYAKDGKDGGVEVYAYNVGLDSGEVYADTMLGVAFDKNDWIATPDTLTVDEIDPVPEPSSLLLATFGAFAVPAIARRRRRLKGDSAAA